MKNLTFTFRIHFAFKQLNFVFLLIIFTHGVDGTYIKWLIKRTIKAQSSTIPNNNLTVKNGPAPDPLPKKLANQSSDIYIGNKYVRSLVNNLTSLLLSWATLLF